MKPPPRVPSDRDLFKVVVLYLSISLVGLVFLVTR